MDLIEDTIRKTPFTIIETIAIEKKTPDLKETRCGCWLRAKRQLSRVSEDYCTIEITIISKMRKQRCAVF